MEEWALGPIAVVFEEPLEEGVRARHDRTAGKSVDEERVDRVVVEDGVLDENRRSDGGERAREHEDAPPFGAEAACVGAAVDASSTVHDARDDEPREYGKDAREQVHRLVLREERRAPER